MDMPDRQQQQQHVHQWQRALTPFPSVEVAGGGGGGEGNKEGGGAAGERPDPDCRTDLDKPLVLTGAMEMLATALVSLPAGDVEGAMQCVG